MTTPAASKREIAEQLVDACVAAGTTHVFGVPGGGSNLDVVGAAIERDVPFVLTHTETAGVMMAAVAGELTGAPGVALATRGPGAASTVNGTAQALLDRQPVVVVTDCVAASEWERVSHQRLHQAAVMAPVAKASVVLDGRTPTAAAEVVHLACSGRPGPVHVDIDPSAPATAVPTIHTTSGPPHRPLAALLAAARRPVVVVGVGAIALAPAERERLASLLTARCAAAEVPVLSTYRARGVVPDSSSVCAGVATGATIESPLLHAADLVVGVGLDPVEFIPAAWPYAAPVVMLGQWPIHDSTWFGDRLAAEVLGHLVSLVDSCRFGASTWPPGTGARHAERARAELLATRTEPTLGLAPHDVVTVAANEAPPDTVATVDAGAHMLLAVPLWPCEQPCDLLISSGLATMGFALPAAIASALVRPERRVVCFTGDGGLGMVLAELETAVRCGLAITVVVFDDATLSLIAAKQHPTRHGGEAAVAYRPIHFAAVATAMGMAAQRVDTIDGYRAALRQSFARRGPTLLDVVVDPSSYGAVLDAVRGARPI